MLTKLRVKDTNTEVLLRTQYYEGLKATYVIQDDNPALQYYVQGSEEKFHKDIIKQAESVGDTIIETPFPELVKGGLK